MKEEEFMSILVFHLNNRPSVLGSILGLGPSKPKCGLCGGRSHFKYNVQKYLYNKNSRPHEGAVKRRKKKNLFNFNNYEYQ